MRRCIVSILFLVVALLLTGMGGLGGDPEGTLPETEKNFSVAITDRGGVETSLKNFSMDGSTFLHAKLGNASVTVAFEDIEVVEFKSMANEMITVALALKGDKELVVKIRRRSGFAGQMDVGILHIRAEDVARIVFQ